jgi:uncharacterized membrane protein YccC
MHYALNPRTFLFSHYFYTGLRIAIGVIGLTSLVLFYSDLPTALTVCIGELCTIFKDLPSPLGHKFHEMLASVLLCSMVTLVITLSAPIHWLLSVVIVPVSFLASMMVIYGKKTMPLQFAALFIMTLSMENALTVRQALLHSALFLGGASAYLAYAMAAAWFLRNRVKQQVLAEALFELARYIKIKSAFYDMHTDLNSQFNLLVRQQSVLADKQQASRDLILRGPQNARDAILLQVHFGMLDLYELILSTHTDYALLHRYLADADILSSLHSMAAKAALDTESIAFAVTRKRASFSVISYQAEKQAIELDIERRQACMPDAGRDEALTVLRTSYNKLCEIVDTIGQLHVATQIPAGPLPMLPGADMTPFLTQQKYELGLLVSNLRWESPAFRFALRVAMAISVGLLISEHLPYSSHGYWIVLTIAIVLKPTFSMTKQRRNDRLAGTLIGCVLTAVIVHFVHAPVALLGFLFLATVAVPSFTYIKYRYTAIAATMQILLQISMLVPSNTHVIGERMIDTFVGVAIATLFSFVLPSWEYRALPRLIKNVLDANKRYIDAGCDLLTDKVTDDFVYRICRKRFLDNLAGLSAALVRMLDEPASKQRAVEDIHLFMVQNYLLVAHVAALRLLLRRHASDLPKAVVNARLQQTCTQVWNTLSDVERSLKILMPLLAASNGKQPETPRPSAPVPVPAAPGAGAWSGWSLLQRRLSLLQTDADQIATRGVLIGRALSNPH